MLCKIGALRNFGKFPGKHLCQSLFLNKVAGLCNFIKKEALAQVFPVNFVEFLRTPFLRNISGNYFYIYHLTGLILIISRPARTTHTVHLADIVMYTTFLSIIPNLEIFHVVNCLYI